MKERVSFPIFFVLAFFAGLLSYQEDIPLEFSSLSVSGKTQTSNTTISPNEFYHVVRVVDGDTIVVKINDKKEMVRLIGMNTPETVDPRKPVECFGKEAAEEAKKILTDRSVRLETDPSQDQRDRYGRLLAYVFLPDGTNFSRLMIETGYGYEYTYDLPYKYQTEFKQAEKDAKENDRGLWARNVCGENF
ncbi:MAG: thermonuclease family protein [Candidatus Paceibacterota bacterium]|jgi:micrococcal nuclease|nr:thermonuclease family protein [Candidatus Paceibacterota bacterium]